MRRRYIALLAIFVPTAIIYLLHRFGIVDAKVLYGYIVAVTLVFKSSILSFLLASKLKIIAFIKSLTLFQAITLAIKRFLIDNMISNWLNRYIFKYFKRPFIEIYGYYKTKSFKDKIKNLILFILPTAVVVWIMVATDLFSSFAFYVEIKMIVIGFFKALWLFLGKIFGFIPLIFNYLSNSWLGPILEIFALSWLLDFIERAFGKNNPITRFFNYISRKLTRFLNYIGLLNDKHLEPILYNSVAKQSKNIANKLTQYIQNKKIELEYIYFERLLKTILNRHIDSYYSFKDMHKIKDKKRLYTLINKKSADGIDIVAFVSRDEHGNLVDDYFENSFYHDIFILEGMASSKDYGVKVNLDDGIDYTDFWILNTSRYPVDFWLNGLEKQRIDGNDLVLIKTDNHIDFEKDIFFEYKKVVLNATSLETPKS